MVKKRTRKQEASQQPPVHKQEAKPKLIAVLDDIAPSLGRAAEIVDRALQKHAAAFPALCSQITCRSCGIEARNIEPTNVQMTPLAGGIADCPAVFMTPEVERRIKEEIRKKVNQDWCRRKCPGACRCVSKSVTLFSISDSEHRTVYLKRQGADFPEVPVTDPNKTCQVDFDVDFDIDLVVKYGLCFKQEFV